MQAAAAASSAQGPGPSRAPLFLGHAPFPLPSETRHFLSRSLVCHRGDHLTGCVSLIPSSSQLSTADPHFPEHTGPEMPPSVRVLWVLSASTAESQAVRTLCCEAVAGKPVPGRRCLKDGDRAAAAAVTDAPAREHAAQTAGLCTPGERGLPHTPGDPGPELSCMFPFHFRRQLEKMLSYLLIWPAPHRAVNGVTCWARRLEIVGRCLLTKGKDQVSFPFSCCQCLTSSNPTEMFSRF